ncbi:MULTISPECIES: DUF2470 domain-containing protein [Subtercola]|uniref:DUF2470 domain-containing protein n=1 Tax=Subtercola vilae TaxID=2056433 RepID=A0A4T2CFV6_9MICO|nr:MULTISPECIES: DUF2470 domain-containing protein [Subtercola]MEA9984014.1 DUF2470 domain-containing protein [Subtercola sp. RTI3]TIH41008.1 DUF2470 domain-containing protein [Subtercola vilae]
MTHFEADVVAAILAHMNNDHPEDNLVIVRAFGAPDAERATMVDLDTVGGTWAVSAGTDAGAGSDAGTDHGAGGESAQLGILWPGGTIETRGEIRREIVALYDAASEALGLPPRQH